MAVAVGIDLGTTNSVIAATVAGQLARIPWTARLVSTGAAVVSRGGRPDLAGEYLRSVVRPALLIAGARARSVSCRSVRGGLGAQRVAR